MKESYDPIKRGFIVGGTVVVTLLVLGTVFGSFGTVSTGNRGIKTRFGKVLGEVSTGLYFKLPFIESVDTIDVQIQKEQVGASAASKDLQTVNANVAVNYNIDPTKVVDLFSRISTDYKSRIIDPAIQEAVKSVTANYTAEELITKREEVTGLIKQNLSEKLVSSDMIVTAVSITNFDFSPSFNAAIEAKVTAEQNALAAKNKLDQIKYEAAQTIATAQAQAESIKIQAQAINSQGGADYVQLQAIAKWNGNLPTQMIPGATVPFINLK